MAHIYRSMEETRETLRNVANYLAVFLSEGGSGWDGASKWTYTNPEGDNWQHKIVGPDEAVIYVTLEGDTKGDRINLSGGFHIGTSKWGNSEYVRPNSGVPSSISVALSRGNAVIAAELKRRYLPAYLKALAEARTQRDHNEAYHNAKLSNLQRLQNLGGDTRKLDYDAERGYLHIGETYGYIQTTDNSASLELRCLTMAQAEAIIKVLKGKT